MEEGPVSKREIEGSNPTVNPEIGFTTLLYRFLFFDWMFADMTMGMTLFERHAAWQHNRKMRIHLPLYLRRWSVLTHSILGLAASLKIFWEASWLPPGFSPGPA